MNKHSNDKPVLNGFPVFARLWRMQIRTQGNLPASKVGSIIAAVGLMPDDETHHRRIVVYHLAKHRGTLQAIRNEIQTPEQCEKLVRQWEEFNTDTDSQNCLNYIQTGIRSPVDRSIPPSKFERVVTSLKELITLLKDLENKLDINKC